MPRSPTVKPPKGRNNPALGNAAPGNQSPVEAAQIRSAARHSGWRNTNLGAVIASIDTGKSFRCEERPPTEAEVGVVKVSAVTWGTYDEEESKTCLDAARIEPRYLIEEGDFLFSRANTIQLIGSCVIAGADLLPELGQLKSAVRASLGWMYGVGLMGCQTQRRA